MLGSQLSHSRNLAVAGLFALLLPACERSATPVASHEAMYSHGIEKPRTPEFNRQLAALRQATAQYHNFERALQAGYDDRITPCWYHRDLGAMGFHYADENLIPDGTVSLLEPEALMYEPGPAGQMRLVGVEYIVRVSDWPGEDPPTLLGEQFDHNDELGLYTFHVWLWRHNPRGIFAHWNPMVSCEHTEEREDRAP